MLGTDAEKSAKNDEICIPLSENLDKPNNNEEDEIKPVSYFLKNMASLAIPNTLNGIAWMIQSLIGIYFAGLLNDVKLLDGMSLGTTWVGIAGFSIICGLASAMDTFVSQAYGRQDFIACGLVLNKAFAIVGTMSLPCIILVWSSKIIFSLVGIDKEVVLYSYNYSMSIIPSMILYAPQIIIEKFLIGQQISKPQMIFQIINAVLFPLYCYIGVFTFNLGLYGIAVAKTFASIAYIGMMIAYIQITKCCEKAIIKPTQDIFYGWSEYLKVALPSLLMICLEWWSYEILNLVSGKIGIVALASNTIGINYANVIYLCCAGVGSASGTLVGNSIGEHKINNAKTYVAVGTGSTLLLMGILNSGLIFNKHFFARFFTTDPEVVHVLETLIYFVAMLELFDGTQGTLGRILFGMGLQNKASMINLVAYWAIMIPLGIIFGLYLEWDVYGIYSACIISGSIVVMGFSYLLCKADWEQIIKLADERTENVKKE